MTSPWPSSPRAGPVTRPSPPPRSRGGGAYFTQECESAWLGFGQQPGTHLRWVKVTGGTFRSARYELRTAEQQAIASAAPDERHAAGQAGGRSFTWEKTPVPCSSTAGSWPSGITELPTCGWRDVEGHFDAETRSSRAHRRRACSVGGFVDETGTPILYVSGTCYLSWLTIMDLRCA